MNWELQSQFERSVRWIEFQSNSESWEPKFLYTQEFNIISKRDGWESMKTEKDAKWMQHNLQIQKQMQVPKTNNLLFCNTLWHCSAWNLPQLWKWHLFFYIEQLKRKDSFYSKNFYVRYASLKIKIFQGKFRKTTV